MNWIFAYNINDYDLDNAIHTVEYIDWKTTNVTEGKIRVGDYVY